MTRKTQMTADECVEPAAAQPTRIALVFELLRRPEGATLDELMMATGWQAHSIRAVLTGLRKKGHTLVREKRDEVSCYRLVVA